MNAYNGSFDLEPKNYHYNELFGCLLLRIYADKICFSREKRKLMKDLEIQIMGKSLGRRHKNKDTEHESTKAEVIRYINEIEATFGKEKRVYKANKIRAKQPETANCWIGMCYFVIRNSANTIINKY